MNDSPAFNFALMLKNWEADHVPCFTDGKLVQRIFLLLAESVMKSKPLRLTEVYVSSTATEVGVRKRIRQLCDDGWIDIVTNEKDKRTKIVVPSKKFLLLIQEYQDKSAFFYKKSFKKV